MLFNTRSALIVRKGYQHIEKIDSELMWLDAFGLQDVSSFTEIRRNTGIWAPDAGPCQLKESKITGKPCKIPGGFLMYPWAKREKVSPYCSLLYS